MNASHTVSTTDPINGFDITDLTASPHLVEGDSANDLTIYFKNQASRQVYIDMPVEHPEQGLTRTLSNPTDDYGS